jgi:hypothetical protein
MPVFPARTPLQKQFPRAVENENVHGAMPQVIPMHFTPRGRPKNTAHYVQHHKLLGREHAQRSKTRRLDEIGQRDPLLERQLLRSRWQRNSDLARGAWPICDLPLEQLSKLFSPLRKSATHERNKQFPIVISQFVRRTGSQTNESGIDVRLWQKDAR